MSDTGTLDGSAFRDIVLEAEKRVGFCDLVIGMMAVPEGATQEEWEAFIDARRHLDAALRAMNKASDAARTFTRLRRAHAAEEVSS